MALKKIVFSAVLVAGVNAFACSKVEEALTLNAAPVKKAKEADKAPKSKVFDTLNGGESKKTELPKNARHDATAGVFI